MSEDKQDNARERGGWIGFLIARPIAVVMLVLTIGVLGAISYLRIPIQLMPSGFGSQDLSIYIPYPNASPYETLEKVTRMVEEEISTIPGIVKVNSQSSADNAQVFIEFSGTADMDLAYAEVRDRMERVRPRLPNGADRYFIWRFNLDESAPVIWGGMLFDLESHDDRANFLSEEVIKKRIESIEGVARMQIFGALDQTVRILLDEDRCRAARIQLDQVITRLAKDNFTLPAGRVEESELRYHLRVDAKYRSLEEIRQVPVTDQLKIGDIAEVKYVQSIQDNLARINGKYALFTAISRNSGANIVEVCKNIDEAMRGLEARPDLAGFKFLKWFDQGQMIAGSLGNLGESALWGAIYAVAVLFLFLHRVQLTLLVALSIPLSILITLVYQYFSGDTFNLCSMMGLTLGVGMLVDNSIVVIENTYRLRQLGRPFREAAVQGAREVALAITLATLTSIVVFLPMMFLSEERNLRVAFMAIGMPLSISLLASLLAAVVFIPAAIYHMQSEGSSRTEKFFSKMPSLMPLLTRGIQGILSWTMRHRVAAFFIVFGLVGTSQFPAGKIQKSQGGDGGQHFHIELDLPRNTTMAEASDEVKIVEDWVMAQKGTKLTNDNYSNEFDRQRADVVLWYNQNITPEKLGEEVKFVKESVPKRAGVKVRIRTHMGGEGGEQSGGMRLVLTGKDYRRLAELGTEVKRRLETIPEFSSVTTALDRGRQELRVEVDRSKASSFGVSPQIVQEYISWGLRGYSLPRFQEEERELPLIIQFAKGADESLEGFKDLRIASPAVGREVPLAALANFSFESSSTGIWRENGKTVLTVNADSQEKDLTLIAAKARAALADLEFPTGYGWYEQGGLQQWEEDANEILSAGLLAVVLVFLLMGILFESIILPISVLLTIPFAAVGGFWLLYLTGTPLDMVGMIGFVILVGVVVNNGILLVDHINRLRQDGLERAAAVVQAVGDRLRPILMTALTTIVGLLPLALSKTNPDEGISYSSLATAVIGGLSISTLFTLWVVPLFYTLVEDSRDAILRAIRKS